MSKKTVDDMIGEADEMLLRRAPDASSGLVDAGYVVLYAQTLLMRADLELRRQASRMGLIEPIGRRVQDELTYSPSAASVTPLATGGGLLISLRRPNSRLLESVRDSWGRALANAMRVTRDVRAAGWKLDFEFDGAVACIGAHEFWYMADDDDGNHARVKTSTPYCCRCCAPYEASK